MSLAPQCRFYTAAILDGRTMKIICIRKDFCSHGKNNLLFLPSNMAVVQNFYTFQFGTALLTGNKRKISEQVSHLNSPKNCLPVLFTSGTFI